MLFVETGGETKVGELDVAQLVDQDVVGFDITGTLRQCLGYGEIEDRAHRWMKPKL